MVTVLSFQTSVLGSTSCNCFQLSDKLFHSIVAIVAFVLYVIVSLFSFFLQVTDTVLSVLETAAKKNLLPTDLIGDFIF